jgi:outer membrane lipoprotein-sorting protein
VRQDQATIGEWEARVLVRDLKQSKTFIVNADFFAEKPDQMRMDITTPLGMHVASVALNNGKMTYIVPQKKAFYEGAPTSEAFARTLNFALDPKLIMNVLFDQPVEAKGWTCTAEASFVSECSQKNFKITWANRKSKEKTVVITHAQYQVELKFHNFSVPQSLKPEMFTIKKPEGFNRVN